MGEFAGLIWWTCPAIIDIEGLEEHSVSFTIGNRYGGNLGNELTRLKVIDPAGLLNLEVANLLSYGQSPDSAQALV